MTTLARNAAALAAAAAVAAVVTAVVVTPAAAGPAPFPVAPREDPAPVLAQEVPGKAEVTRILSDLADPDISDQEKETLVQGGVGNDERKAFRQDRLKKAAKRGKLPVTFSIGNIWPVGPDTAAAEVTVSGGKFDDPATKVLTFIKQEQWMLSSDSAALLVDTFNA